MARVRGRPCGDPRRGGRQALAQLERSPVRWRPGADRRAVFRTKSASFADVTHLVQMRVDLVGDLIEMTPLLAELRRTMRRVQQLAALPLDVIDDALAIEAAM